METITHYASFPATGVSLRQMVQFGDRPSTGESSLFLLAVAVLISTRNPLPRLPVRLRRAPHPSRA